MTQCMLTIFSLSSFHKLAKTTDIGPVSMPMLKPNTSHHIINAILCKTLDTHWKTSSQFEWNSGECQYGILENVYCGKQLEKFQQLVI